MAVNEMMQQWVDGVGERFHPERAGTMNAVFQFRFTGEGGGSWYMTIADKTFEIAEGEAESPKVALVCSVEDWSKVLTRKIDTTTLYTMGRLHIKGPLHLAERLAYIIS